MIGFLSTQSDNDSICNKDNCSFIHLPDLDDEEAIRIEGSRYAREFSRLKACDVIYLFTKGFKIKYVISD